MQIDYIPVGFENGMNNLMWVISQYSNRQVILLDPGYPKIIKDYVEQNNLTVAGILITHHHYDHTDGVRQFIETNENLPVWGPHHSPFKLINQPLEDGDTLEIENLQLSVEVIATPGHTLDHIAYHFKNEKTVFVGDALFGAGCGILLEGTYQQLKESAEKLMDLPDDSKLYFGHDYTIQNLEFAHKMEPENEAIKVRLNQCKENPYNGFATVKTEKETNPFVRSHIHNIKKHCELEMGKTLDSDLAVFTTLRKLR